LRPHRQLVAARLEEVEAPPAREGEDRLHDLAARGLDLGQRRLERLAVQDDQRAAALRAAGNVGAEESAVQARVRERGIVRAVADETPAKGLGEEALAGVEVQGRELDV